MTTIYPKILMKRSDVPGMVPTIPANPTDMSTWKFTDVADGEIFLNTADNLLYVRNGTTINTNTFLSNTQLYIGGTSIYAINNDLHLQNEVGNTGDVYIGNGTNTTVIDGAVNIENGNCYINSISGTGVTVIGNQTGVTQLKGPVQIVNPSITQLVDTTVQAGDHWDLVATSYDRIIYAFGYGEVSGHSGVNTSVFIGVNEIGFLYGSYATSTFLLPAGLGMTFNCTGGYATGLSVKEMKFGL